MTIRVHPWLKHWLLPGLVLGFLWFTLINTLRLEWAVNPQYGYGWAVPFLCLYLLYLRIQNPELPPSPPRPGRGNKGEVSISSRDHVLIAHSAIRIATAPFHASNLILVCILALAWLPIRLVREANPEWRLVSWALALVVVGLTLTLLRLMAVNPCATAASGTEPPSPPRPGRGNEGEVSNHAVQNFSVSKFPHFSVSSFVFPILFFLVAVPWPTIIEGPLIQSLTRANVAATIELLNFLGVPALQHGNLIEVGTGVVGIDEACSGIRSFQASLMISLFFGELYRLSILRRLSLCFSGFALSFVFNIGRTSLLTWVASQDGVEAIAKWHDPAGVTILVLCFITLWLLSLCLSRRSQSFAPTGREGARRREGVESTESGTGAPPASPSPPRPGRGTEGEVSISSSNVPPAFASPPPCPTSRSAIPQSANRNPHSPGPSILHPQFRLLWLLAAWFLFSEIAVEGWYRWQEHQVPLAAKWSVAWPTDNPSFKPLPFSEKTAQFLRQDEGANGSWSESDGTRWQMIFLRWNPGKIAVHLAKSHTPQACLPATGRKLVSESGPQILRIGQLNLPFRHYVASDAGRIVQVFYCLWEDQTTDQGFAATGLTWWNRVEPVLAGRRNRGQRSLELAIWGIDDPAQAEAAVCAQLEKLLRVEK